MAEARAAFAGRGAAEANEAFAAMGAAGASGAFACIAAAGRLPRPALRCFSSQSESSAKKGAARQPAKMKMTGKMLPHAHSAMPPTTRAKATEH